MLPPATCALHGGAKQKKTSHPPLHSQIPRGRRLKGHNFGNLFVAALTEITAILPRQWQLSSKILPPGHIYPQPPQIQRWWPRWTMGVGARRNQHHGQPQADCRTYARSAQPSPLPETLEAIERADLITWDGLALHSLITTCCGWNSGGTGRSTGLRCTSAT